MSRDYKDRAAPRPRSRKPSPAAWLLTGLAIGLFVAFLMYVKLRGGTTGESAPARPEPMALPDADELPEDSPEPEKTIPPPPPSRFIFYDELPQMKVEVVVPEHEIKGETKEGVRQVEEPGTYLLQAGSFRNAEQADQLRAKLALLGLETRVQSGDNGGEQWHRVRVGPYKTLRDLNQARNLLEKNGIQAILISLK